MGKAARIRGRREREAARKAVADQADREKLEEAFGDRLGDLEDALRNQTDLIVRVPGKSIAGGRLQALRIADGPKLQATIEIVP